MDKKVVLEELLNYNEKYDEEINNKTQIIEFINANSDFYTKANLSGHLTCSSWIINEDRDKVLLTHHVKLDKWLQLGGHIEADNSLLEAALREAKEESGLSKIFPVQKEIFDIDIHFIPDFGSTNGHYHYDIRYIFSADSNEPLTISDESNALRWFSFQEFRDEITEWSLVRMLDKTSNLD